MTFDILYTFLEFGERGLWKDYFIKFNFCALVKFFILASALEAKDRLRNFLE